MLTSISSENKIRNAKFPLLTRYFCSWLSNKPLVFTNFITHSSHHVGTWADEHNARILAGLKNKSMRTMKSQTHLSKIGSFRKKSISRMNRIDFILKII